MPFFLRYSLNHREWYFFFQLSTIIRIDMATYRFLSFFLYPKHVPLNRFWHLYSSFHKVVRLPYLQHYRYLALKMLNVCDRWKLECARLIILKIGRGSNCRHKQSLKIASNTPKKVGRFEFDSINDRWMLWKECTQNHWQCIGTNETYDAVYLRSVWRHFLSLNG